MKYPLVEKILAETESDVLKMDKWTGWRAEEREDAERYLRSLKKLPTIKGTYFLRDVVVSYLETTNGDWNNIDVNFIADRLKSILGKDVARLVLDSFNAWGAEETAEYLTVQAYRTPKSLLYTIRGDYD